MTLVSAITPTFRRPEFVEGAVETVLEQTHDDVEIVVVCDPPVDATKERLEQYADDDRVRPVYNDDRLGIARSRNRALEAARGEYVCILDDDDRWHPEKVERQLAVMEDDPECGAVYTGGLVRRDGRFVGSYTPAMAGDIYPEIVARFGLKPYSSHMIRAECFDAVGDYDPSFVRGEDWDHSIRVAREYEYRYVPDPLVVREFHEDNATERFDDDQLTRDSDSLEDAIDVSGRIREKYREVIDDHPDIERRLQNDRHITNGWNAIDRNERLQALRFGWKATRRRPSVESLAILLLACLGPTALDAIRRVQYSMTHSQLSGAAEIQT